jgi:Ca-activated chloride channel family protein
MSHRSTYLLVLGLALPLAAPGCAHRKQHVVLKQDAADPTAAADPDRVLIEHALANRFVKAGAAEEVLARIHIGTQGTGDRPRPPANVALVMDTSSSMKGEAIEEAKKAALTLLEALDDGDTLSVVVFGSHAETIVPAVMLDQAARTKIAERLRAIEESGTTDLAGGLAAGLTEIHKGRSSGVEMLHRVVLLSDGVPNDEAPILSLAQQAAAASAPITALGLGLEYHETLLAQLAQTSGGTFHFVEDATAVATVFADEVLDLDRVVAQGVSLRLTPGPGVSILEVVGHTPSTSGRSTWIGLGDLHEGGAHDVLVRMAVGEHKAGATVELLDTELTFTDATTAPGQSFARRGFLSAEATDDTAAIADARDPELAVMAARMKTAAATMRIMGMARAGQMDEAKAELARVRTEAEAAAKDADDPELSRMVEDLARLKKTLPELAPQPAATVGATGTGMHGGGKPKTSMPRPAAADEVMPAAMSEDAARHNRDVHSRAYQMVHG